MKKLRFILLCAFLIVFSLALTSCTLFSDDDIKVSNKYVPYVESEDAGGIYAGNVKAKEIEGLPNVYCFKSIGYANNDTVLNTYKTTGANYNGYQVNNNEDYFGNTTKNNYDLYVPSNLNKNVKNTVILFIHGGAWISGFKTDVNEYVHEFAKTGYISATLKYTLLNKDMNDNSLSIFRNLDEIDSCIKSIKEVLVNDLGFDSTKLNLVIGGASSGAHLAMLYSYSRGEASALPIKFVIDAVGPVDIKTYSWKKFIVESDSVLDAGLSKSAIAAQEANSNLAPIKVSGESYTWNDYQTMRIANGMCGLPFTVSQVEASTDSDKEYITNPNTASNSLLGTNGGEDLLSVTYWINKNSYDYPIICAYAGKDRVVGINQYAVLENALISNGITYDYVYFRNSNHTDISAEFDSTSYNSLINKIKTWCNNI